MSGDFPSLPALRVFEAAVRTGSFRSAADELALSPSAISHAIASLEAALGVELFARDGRLVRTTDEGAALARHVAPAFELLRRGMDDLVARRAQGPLAVQVAPNFARGWLAPRLNLFEAAHPTIELRLAVGSSEAEADVLISDGHGGRTDYLPLRWVPRTATPLCHPDIAGQLQDPRALADRRLIAVAGDEASWPRWLALNGVTTVGDGTMRCEHEDQAIVAAADGLGIALASPLHADREISAGQLVVPFRNRSTDLQRPPLLILARKGRAAYPPARVFVRWLADLLEKGGFATHAGAAVPERS